MNKDFDFFEASGLGGQQPDDTDAGNANDHTGGAMSHRRSEGVGDDRQGRSGAGKAMGRVAGGLGLVSLIAGAAILTHAIAPSVNMVFSNDVLIAICVVAALISIAGTVVARRQAHRAFARRRPGTVAIVMIVAAGLCAVLGLLIAHMTPDGVVKPAVRDDAPISSIQQMKQGIDAAAGACTSGWKDMDVSSYPGVGDVSLCEDSRMAFVTFDTTASASMDRGAATNVIEQQLKDHADDTRAQGDWKILNGGRWMVVGNDKSILALQRLWGGTIASVQS